MKTDKRKNFRGQWTMTTVVELPEMGDEWFLEFYTGKFDKFLTTSAKVNKRDGYFVSHRMFQDFFKRTAADRQRCTEKNVIDQHQAALAQLDSIKAAALAHYVIA